LLARGALHCRVWGEQPHGGRPLVRMHRVHQSGIMCSNCVYLFLRPPNPRTRRSPPPSLPSPPPPPPPSPRPAATAAAQVEWEVAVKRTLIHRHFDRAMSMAIGVAPDPPLQQSAVLWMLNHIMYLLTSYEATDPDIDDWPGAGGQAPTPDQSSRMQIHAEREQRIAHHFHAAVAFLNCHGCAATMCTSVQLAVDRGVVLSPYAREVLATWASDPTTVSFL
jgi:hypothetical protein